MPWNRNNEPDPLEAKRRQLEEQQRLLAEQMSRLSRQLNGESLPEDEKPVEPPVWRMEEDSTSRRLTDPLSPRKRNLARQRQNDMILFFIFMGVLLVAICIFFWLWHIHYAAMTSGA